MTNPAKSKLDYLIVLLLILISANPYVIRSGNIFIFVLLFFLIIRSKFNIATFIQFDRKTFLILLFVLAYELLHSVIFSNLNILNTLRIATFMYVGYLVVKILKFNVITIYVSCIYFLTFLSLLLYPLMYTSYGLALKEMADHIFRLPESILNEYYYVTSMIVYTFDDVYFEGLNTLYRNAGFAWEAGAFANYINIALLFNLFFLNKNKSPLNIRNLIFVGAIVTTFSTTGYIVMFIIISVYLVSIRRYSKINYVYLILFLFISIYIFQSAFFLREKISTQYKEAAISQNRFGSALLDLKDIMRRPLFGWSRDTEVLFGKNNILEAHRPNGITNLLRSYGFVYFIIYFSLLYASFKKLAAISKMKKPGTFAIFFISVLLICAFSQLIFDHLLFRSFVFWGDYIIGYRLIRNNRNNNNQSYHVLTS